MNECSPSRVVVFGLGGTIAMASAATGGVVPTLTAADLVAAVPGLAELGFDVQVVQLRQLPGASLALSDIQELSKEIARWAASATGFVVTQGTDTIEETSYLLDILHTLDHPIVVTGAMRNPSMAGADGPANLLAAITVAADPKARGVGCVVVLNDQIHSASRVRKQHSTSMASFASPEGGPLGYIVEGRPIFLNTIQRSGSVPARLDNPPTVPIHTASLGERDAVLRAIRPHIDGLVVAGMGVGHVPASLVEVLAELAAEKPVVLTSRTGSGPALRSTYGFLGSERDLISRGLIPAGFLSPVKARVLLAAAMSSGADLATIRRAFAVASGYDCDERWPWPTTSDKNV